MLQLPDHAGTLAWTLTWAYLLWCQVAQASGGAWKSGRVDYTGALMVLTLKCVAAAVAWQDGCRAKWETAAAKKGDGDGAGAAGGAAGGRPARAPAPLSAYATTHALRAMPTPLEFAGYCMTCGGLLAGPFLELDDYLAWARSDGVWAAGGAPWRATLAATGRRVLKGVACGAAWVLLSTRFSPLSLESPSFFGASLPAKLALLWLAGVTDRLKYYAVWAVAEAGLIGAGLSYAPGADAGAPPSFERYTNARVLAVELATSAAQLPAHWNVCTGRFLRHYVYERLARGSRGGFRVMLATQAVAGVWHGVFPGYAMFFMSTAFMFEASKALYRSGVGRAAPPRAKRRPSPTRARPPPPFQVRALLVAGLGRALPPLARRQVALRGGVPELLVLRVHAPRRGARPRRLARGPLPPLLPHGRHCGRVARGAAPAAAAGGGWAGVTRASGVGLWPDARARTETALTPALSPATLSLPPAPPWTSRPPAARRGRRRLGRVPSRRMALCASSCWRPERASCPPRTVGAWVRARKGLGEWWAMVLSADADRRPRWPTRLFPPPLPQSTIPPTSPPRVPPSCGRPTRGGRASRASSWRAEVRRGRGEGARRVAAPTRAFSHPCTPSKTLR